MVHGNGAFSTTVAFVIISSSSYRPRPQQITPGQVGHGHGLQREVHGALRRRRTQKGGPPAKSAGRQNERGGVRDKLKVLFGRALSNNGAVVSDQVLACRGLYLTAFRDEPDFSFDIHAGVVCLYLIENARVVDQWWQRQSLLEAMRGKVLR